MGSALIGTSAILTGAKWLATPEAVVANAATIGGLAWKSTPVNKRTGVTVFDAENAGYNIRFVTYLSRFLLVFDNDCQKWW